MLQAVEIYKHLSGGSWFVLPFFLQFVYHNGMSSIIANTSFMRFFLVVKRVFVHPVPPDPYERRRRIISRYSFDVLAPRNPEY